MCKFAHRILDNLPVAMVKMRKDEKANSLVKLYERGFPVGFAATSEVGGDRSLTFRRGKRRGEEAVLCMTCYRLFVHLPL